jgi:hypothetical protein
LNQDLRWLHKQIKVKRLPEKNFYESYIVVGTEKVTSRFAKPECLMSYPTRENMTELSKQLIEEETLEVIADFCFPNGVMCKYVPYDLSISLDSQTVEVIEEV